MQAGQRGAVTIATNMAGRGTDIKLGHGVKELGGLCVIGTERHESRRIDNQQSAGTLTLIASGAHHDDQDSASPASASSTVTAGYINKDSHYQGLSQAERQALLSLETTGRPVTANINSLGNYRVQIGRAHV